MVTINYALREINCKIVYYGPGLSGKTTNLQFVHGKVPASARGDLISLATEADRTLYFDFLPVDVGRIAGFDTKFQLYTVPGQVFYNATRRLVLRGVDGLVFVADSQISKMDENIESLDNMFENLKECGIESNSLPLVIQWNKRDLPDIHPVSVLEEKLNPQGLPSFEAVAATGEGVFDTLKKITKMVLNEARTRATSKSPGTVPEPTSVPVTPDAVGVPQGSPAVPVETPAVAAVYRQPDVVESPSVVGGRQPQIMPRQPAAPEYASTTLSPALRESALSRQQDLPKQPAAIHREPSLKIRQRAASPGVYRAQKSLKVRRKRNSIFTRFFRWILGR